MPIENRANRRILLTAAIALALSVSVWSLPAAAQGVLPLVRPQTDAVTGAVGNEARQAARSWDYPQRHWRGVYYASPQNWYPVSPYSRDIPNGRWSERP
jgi:hypothetical protein